MYRVKNQLNYNAVQKLKITGKGIGVGVLDSGIFPHIDFDNRIKGFRNFTNDNNQEVYDAFGHGTHVCGIIGGSGKASYGTYQGMAPKVNLYIAKVLDSRGNGKLNDMINGLNWILDISKRENIKIINISISSVSFQDKWKEHLLMQLFLEAYENNIMVICAAGNKGPNKNTISILGDSVHTICVGCYDGAYYANNPYRCDLKSSRGPGNQVYMKPDLVAPGTNIVSCANKQFRYTQKSGTSMATPVVTGALALAYEYYSNDSIYQMKKRLLHSTDDIGSEHSKQGYGMLNINKLLSIN